MTKIFKSLNDALTVILSIQFPVRMRLTKDDDIYIFSER